MRNSFTLLIIAVLAFSSHAQLPKWVIYPQLDSLSIKVDNLLLQSKTGDQTSLWTLDGENLFTTDDVILDFVEDLALVQAKDKNSIKGFVDTKGNFTNLPPLKIAYNKPYFEDGYILCTNDVGALEYYKNNGSKAVLPRAIVSFPFHKGYAPYLTYEQFEKQKNPHFSYYKADGSNLDLKYVDNREVKPVNPNDVYFLSSIGTNGKAVGVIKNKLYWFDPKTEIFEPMLWGDDPSEKKRHLNLKYGGVEQFLNIGYSDNMELVAKFGKDQYAVLKFDDKLLPVEFAFGPEVVTFKEEPKQGFVYSAKVSEYTDNGKYGLSFDNRQVLPAQFEKVGLKYGNKAFVKSNGKWGILEILPDLNYTIKLNKGDEVPFRHQKFETQLRADFPAAISTKEVKIDIPDTTGCVMDKTSRAYRDTENGNVLTYDCVLNIPISLPDSSTTITYQPVNVVCDGVELFDNPISVKAWHVKYYNVDPIESETSISNGIASFSFNVNAMHNNGESDYPFEVKVEGDSLYVMCDKISETRYKCTIDNLQEGENNFNIYITEKGCPSSVFPFEIFYTKPVPKKKKEEEVVIRKKSPAKKEEPRLEL